MSKNRYIFQHIASLSFENNHAENDQLFPLAVSLPADTRMSRLYRQLAKLLYFDFLRQCEIPSHITSLLSAVFATTAAS